MSEYYSKEDLINILKIHLLAEDADRVNWDKVIEDGEVYPHNIEGVDGCFIYQVPCSMDMTIFVHPLICQEVYYDAWTSKDVYMGRAGGEIW